MRGGEVPSCDVGARIGYAYRTTALGAIGAQRVHEKGLEVKKGCWRASSSPHSARHTLVARHVASRDGSRMKGADDLRKQVHIQIQKPRSEMRESERQQTLTAPF